MVRLGDKINGFRENALFEIGKIPGWLTENAVELYPDSEFAKQYREYIAETQATSGFEPTPFRMPQDVRFDGPWYPSNPYTGTKILTKQEL